MHGSFIDAHKNIPSHLQLSIKYTICFAISLDKTLKIKFICKYFNVYVILAVQVDVDQNLKVGDYLVYMPKMRIDKS